MESTVTFFGDLGFDRAHRNVRDFENESKRQTWFANQPHDVFTCNYDKVNRSLKVEMDYTQAMTYSYCIVEIENQKPLYCFVDDVTLINDRTVAFSLSVDVWQTYLFQFTLGRCFVARGHMDRWTKASSTPVMQIYPNEGIDGFQVVADEKQLVQSSGGYDYIWFVMARTVTSDGKSNIQYLLSPIPSDSAYVVRYKSTTGKIFPSPIQITNGVMITGMGIDPNSIVFMGVLPFAPITISWHLSSPYLIVSGWESGTGTTGIAEIGDYSFISWVGPESYDITPGIPLSISIDKPTKPTSYDADDSHTNEPMMYMSPVRKVIAYTGMGSPVWVAPDDLLLQSNGSLPLSLTAMPGASGFTSRVYIGDDFPKADALGRAFDIPSDPVDSASNSWLSYVATERDTTRQLMYANITRNAINQIAGVFKETDALGVTTTPLRVASAAVGIAADTAYEHAALAINEKGIRNKTSGILSSGSGTGSLFLWANEARLVVTEADTTTKNIFFDKVRRMGYNVNKYMTPNLRSRYWFNYIYTINAVVKGSFSESVRSELASIFNGGVTIWHDDAEMDTEKCNIERALL